jgi:Flp pilus assembly protein TadB
MPENSDWEETQDERRHAMVPATPRDVVHIRVGSFLLVFLFALAVLGLIAHAPVMTGIAVVAAIVTVVDIWLAVRRQKSGRAGEAG